MKVFIPMSDRLLTEQATMSGALVPFEADFLLSDIQISPAQKPVNWIPEADYQAAKERLNH